ncbi:MAG: type II toxin-antitoxin system RelE/ParE family toxin [Pseudomonadota bacterium]
MNIDFSYEAEADIAHINREGIRLFGETQAKAYANGLGKAFATIATYPMASPERAYLRRPARVQPYGSHVIIYRVEHDTVLILRIRHGREDWQED